MKTVYMAVFLLVILTQPAFSFNCGNGKLLTEGMHKYQVIKDCGSPASSQIVWRSYSYVEEWVYIQRQYGKKQMFLVRIDSRGVVSEIIWLGESK